MGHIGSMNELPAIYRQKIVDRMVATGQPFDDKNIYGLTDFRAENHIGGHRHSKCSIVPMDEKDIILTERTESEFGDTFSGNRDAVVITGEAFRCTCGQLENITMFIASDFEEIMGYLIRCDTPTDWAEFDAAIRMKDQIVDDVVDGC